MSQNKETSSSEQMVAKLCKRLEAIRLMKNVSQTALAKQSGLSRRTISRMETGHGVSMDTFVRVMQALGLGEYLDTIVPDADIRPIERVKRNGVRKNASSPRKTSEHDSKWEWGE